MSTVPDVEKLLLWGAEAIANEIGVSRRQAFRLLETGQIPGKKVGGRWVVSRLTLAAFFSTDTARSATYAE